ncbi:MAG: hypothetical protein J07HB67_02641 [halophilic archaeon J07HB67]|nr:MAG: hypothetical protein J07HB67_02641 [halophilic archaeon J07HB67]
MPFVRNAIVVAAASTAVTAANAATPARNFPRMYAVFDSGDVANSVETPVS